MNAEKVPTSITYTSEEASSFWGFQVESNANVLAGSKYNLDQDSPIIRYNDLQFMKVKKNGRRSTQGIKSPEDLTAYYFKKLYKVRLARMFCGGE